MRKEIRIAGYGGQGTILAGVILGEAATRAGHEAVQTQSYGPESRGGAARSEVVISDEPVDYPRVTHADVLVALSQPGYDKHAGDVASNAVIVLDEDLVGRRDVEGTPTRAIPFTKTAEAVGHKIVANIVMLGYVNAMLDLLPHEVLEETVLLNVPPKTHELNRKAAAAGRDLFTQAGE